MKTGTSFFSELKRRNVFRVAVLYLVASWAIIQAGEFLFELTDVPRWGLRLLVGLLALGFPIALVFSWVYEITPEGLKRESEVDRSQSITPETARKLDYATIAAVVIVIALFAVDRWYPRTASAPQVTAPVIAKSIAVLPFVNMSGDPNNEYFSDGLTEELLNRLTQVNGLMVAGRTSSFAFKGHNEDLRTIAQKLNVATVLEGSVRKSGDEVRITAQLVDAANGFHRWSQTYDRKLTDIFATQSDIAEQVVSALAVNLMPKEARRLHQQPTQNLEAYDLYLRARQVYQVQSIAALHESVDLLERATQLDPKFAQAYVDFADVLLLLQDTSATAGEDTLDRADAAVHKALAVDASFAPAYAVLGRVEMNRRDGAAAEQAFRRANDLNPKLANPAWPRYLISNMRYVEAEKLVREALLTNPLDLDLWWTLANALMGQEKFLAAVESFGREREIQPSSPTGWYAGATVYRTGLGRMDIAAQDFIHSVELDPADGDLPAIVAEIYLSLGDMAEAERYDQQALKVEFANPLARATHVRIVASQGDLKGAARLAAAALAEGRPSRWQSTIWLLRHIWLGDPRAAAAGAQIERYEQRYPALKQNTPVLAQTYAWWGYTPREYSRAMVDVAGLLLKSGDKERATVLLNEALKFTKSSPRFGRFGYQILDVEAYALRGETDHALARLRDAVESGWTDESGWDMRLDPNLDSLRVRPEFKQIAATLADKMRVQLAQLRETLASARKN